MTDVLVRALDQALATVRANVEAFGTAYPDDCTVAGRYPLRPAAGEFAEGANRGWTTSFVPGQLWLGYELTGEDLFRTAGLAHAVNFSDRIFGRKDLDTHDLGFLYTLASVAPWRLLGDQDARAAALEAADRLMDRFLESAGIVQAWGDLSDPAQRGRTIIDSLMNMPLLAWASEQTGDPHYVAAVRRHTEQLAIHMMRADDTTFHTFYWDADTGEPLRGATEQGAADDSCWARGQAWGIYGFALNHQLTGNDDLLTASQRCADRFLRHLPADGVPFWDLIYGDGDDQPRDSSSAAIAACGLQELARIEPEPERAAAYLHAGEQLLLDLIAGYTPAAEGVDSDALLLHSVYDLPTDNGVDEGCLWGDYFYLEALMRYTNPDWRRYW
ncbi:glycoside hydrolase family 88 protein [Cellulomonas sp. NPDC089187]|uniref:glycoside hydrolase family 88 protein n=1 Tax=Cellulomonas sp. NPDC089187 TaxID=3154970 RepID=UPI003431FB7F